MSAQRKSQSKSERKQMEESSSEMEQDTKPQFDEALAGIHWTSLSVRLGMAKYMKVLNYKLQLLNKIAELFDQAEEGERFMDAEYRDSLEKEWTEHWRELKVIDNYIGRFQPMVRSQLPVAIPALKARSTDHYAAVKSAKHAMSLIKKTEIQVPPGRSQELIACMATVLTQIQRIEGTPEGYSLRNIYLLDDAIQLVGEVVSEENKAYYNTRVKPIFDKLVQMLMKTEEANST